ncbi:hypothetical protein J2X20_001686 [Pelomonas saccharophila]|uniref:Lytic murein transglycosylase n=1 Tax=Roseateles saccharophilus TaxID=304 RepID=A0ABU1YJM9_ROSSA|nr:hypothetical protein [Roseateles saccharophilus]MDR7269057.1 hypothetical protein [Roseateles saccharophilus]
MQLARLCGALMLAMAGHALAEPSTALAQAEADLARATLVEKPGLASARAQFEALRKHFALTPSLHAWGDHAGLLNQLKARGAPEGGDPEAPAWQKLVAAEFAQSQKMRAGLSRDFGKAPAEVLAHPPSTAINVQIAARSSREFKLDPARMTAMGLGRWGGRAPGMSFFKPDMLVAGFAGGPLVGRLRTRDAEGVVYRVSYDARSAAALADLYEIAKARGLAVKATWREAELADLSSSLTNGRGRIDQLQLTLRLPVWVATEKGLLPGVLRSATYGSDGCGRSDKPEDFRSQAEIVLAQPARSPILAVFATTAAVDAARARVLPQRETRLSSATLTHRVDAALDLDGDGVADLRTVISEDREVGQAPWLDPARALADAWRPEHLRKAAGWYAYDLYQLEANEQGWWRVLSRYNLVTCT